MKIVIDVPDEIYKDIKNWKIHNFDYRVPLSCILEGIVLPKGHGDLIDRDELRNVCAINQVDIGSDGNKNTLIIVDTDDREWHDLLSEKYAPTVIKADK